jgi:hypothetical protein
MGSRTAWPARWCISSRRCRRPHRPGVTGGRRRLARCVERWMAVAPDGDRVVPHMGTLTRNGAYGATANRAEVPPYSAGRRAPSCIAQDGESLGPGGQTALPPYLGRPPTLPRSRDPGVGRRASRGGHGLGDPVLPGRMASDPGVGHSRPVRVSSPGSRTTGSTSGPAACHSHDTWRVSALLAERMSAPS